MLSAPNLEFWNKNENWKTKIEDFIFQFLNKNWKLKIEKEMYFFSFQFWIEIEMCKNALFHFNFNLKIKSQNLKISKTYSARIHKTNWFFVLQNTRILKFKLEIRFLFFILIWKTKNQIYLNKYLIKLVTRSHYAITINE